MKYLIAQDTLCSVAKDNETRSYARYRTTKELAFNRYRSKVGNAYTFERDGWILLIRAENVKAIPAH